MSRIGWSVPISLFAAMIETRIVLSVSAARICSACTWPYLSTGR